MTKRRIANYTTEVDAASSVGEILGALSRFGASSINVSYDASQPSSITFAILVSGVTIGYRLDANADGVLAVLERQKVQPRYRTPQHANRVAWRLLRDWIRAQLAIAEAGAASMPHLMLPYAVGPDGRTLSEAIDSGGAHAFALEAGS
jgi:hypothetical protein